ncbi:MAG: tRNA (adenosine(37)-N6)-threonylcarbamoyltransferase complex ATPase subunit type 1 TsaE [Rikenellaceae bacterium]
MIDITISSLEQLRGVAAKIFEALDGRTVVLLLGAMGSGKTTLVREVAAEMGSVDSVTSPTFAIVNEYVTAACGSIFHFDMYRIEQLVEAIDMGFNEYIHSGDLCLIEWPERVEELLPDDAMVVKIEVVSPTERRFMIDYQFE